MKTLLLLRHAKSSWQAPELADHDRPLNERGKRDAPRIGRLLLEEDLAPSLIISSTAKRARKTAEKVAKASGYPGEIQLEDDLYHGDFKGLLGILRNVPEEANPVLVVGHNPDLEDFLELLTGRQEQLSTAALVHITLPVESWQQLPEQPEGELRHIWRPRELE